MNGTVKINPPLASAMNNGAAVSGQMRHLESSARYQQRDRHQGLRVCPRQMQLHVGGVVAAVDWTYGYLFCSMLSEVHPTVVREHPVPIER